jgi:putative iron-regulated protein
MTTLRFWILALAFVYCRPRETPEPGPVVLDPQGVLDNYAANLYTAYGDSLSDATTLQTQIEAFLASPTEGSLNATRIAWTASRAHYMLTEGARFYGGPIDAEETSHETALNSWPLDEAYVDYTTGDANAGLINHPEILPTITATALDDLNGKGGDNNISAGYHAIEFLLWGQATSPVGPGTRPATDYTTRANADRRATYLRVAIAGVVAHLQAVHDAWAPGSEYRTAFTSGGMDSVAKILTGLGRMSKGELGGDRLNAPYASKSRRDQHDCFSSETLTDYERDARGLLALYMGTYGDNSGLGVSTLVRTVDTALDNRVQAQLQASIDAIVAIPKPFESAIVGDDAAPGRVAVHTAITTLRQQGDLIAQAATAIGVTIQVPTEN